MRPMGRIRKLRREKPTPAQPPTPEITGTRAVVSSALARGNGCTRHCSAGSRYRCVYRPCHRRSEGFAVSSRGTASSDARQRNKPGHPEEESENPHGGEPLTSAPDNHFRFSVCSPQHCNDLSGFLFLVRAPSSGPACRPLRGRGQSRSPYRTSIIRPCRPLRGESAPSRRSARIAQVRAA